MPCCGRPNNRAQKNNSYADKYAYLSSSQLNKIGGATLSKCQNCDALTSGNPCTVCGNNKQAQEKEG